MEFHEVANLFPLIEGQEFEELVKDIKENGLQQPIWTYKNKIIDGRNRYRACKKAGVEPRYQEWDGKGSLVAFAVSLNVKRRHLTSSQLSVIALGVEKQLSEEAADRQNLGQKIDQGLSGRSAHQAADMLGTNHEYVSTAKRIEKEAPELIPHITEGTLTIPDAKAIATLPQTRREKVVQKAVQKKEEEGKRVSRAVKDAIVEEEIEIKAQKMEELQKIESMYPPTIKNNKRAVTRGQIWQLGKHILKCDDSSNFNFTPLLETINKNTSSVELAFADPPYNVGVAEWDHGFTWKHDYLLSVAPIVAVTPGISSIQSFMRNTTMPNVWSMAYWIDNGMTRGALGFGNWIYVALFAHASPYRNAQDFSRISISSKDKDELDHKGRKPLAMIYDLIEVFTKEQSVVIDPFLGTGSTLVVCEQMNRVCVGIEINPDYCEWIIKRWEQMTNQAAKLIEEA